MRLIASGDGFRSLFLCLSPSHCTNAAEPFRPTVSVWLRPGSRGGGGAVRNENLLPRQSTIREPRVSSRRKANPTAMLQAQLDMAYTPLLPASKRTASTPYPGLGPSCPFPVSARCAQMSALGCLAAEIPLKNCSLAMLFFSPVKSGVRGLEHLEGRC